MVGAVTYSASSGPMARWNAARLGGSDANGTTWADDPTRNTVPLRSPTNIVPSEPKAIPQATPRSWATISKVPSRWTLRTVPS